MCTVYELIVIEELSLNSKVIIMVVKKICNILNYSTFYGGNVTRKKNKTIKVSKKYFKIMKVFKITLSFMLKFTLKIHT